MSKLEIQNVAWIAGRNCLEMHLIEQKSCNLLP